MSHQAHLSQAGGVVTHARNSRSALTRLADLTLLCFLVLLCASAAWAETTTADAPVPAGPLCQPQIKGVWVAKTAPGTASDRAAPDTGWQPVTLPDRWDARWSGVDGIAWYRIDWTASCATTTDLLGAAFSSVNMAGAIHLNDSLLWRDANMVEPLSRSWNMPRAFLLPPAAVKSGTNTFWIQVIGNADQGAGMGWVRIGPWLQTLAYAEEQRLYRRQLPAANMLITATLGIFFFMLWLLRRQEQAYGWYAFSSMAWVMVGCNTIVTETPWPFTSTLAWSRWITWWLAAYVGAFCMFLWQFGGLVRRWRVRALSVGGVLTTMAMLFFPPAAIAYATPVVFFLCVAIVLAVCVQFIVHALRTRQVEHLLLATCCVGFLAPTIHDALLIIGVLGERTPWTPVTALIITLGMSLVLAGHFTRTLRQVERFNDELEGQIRLARDDLAHTMRREHALELDKALLSERMSVANDLHDSLGSSLVRSVALVERSGSGLQHHHYLSMFKSLRDDLRQIVDTHGSASAAVPDTPAQWLAPIRHRFGRLFDEMGVHGQWQTPPVWPVGLSARQALGLTRLLEEALTNVVKHSRARALEVLVEATDADGERPAGMRLLVQDDGVGFDVALLQHALGGLGLNSMLARITRLGGTMQIESSGQGTKLVFWLGVTITPSAG